jgi:hypothetical protein
VSVRLDEESATSFASYASLQITVENRVSLAISL